MTRILLTHPEQGVYIGQCLGLGFWSKLDPCGQDKAPTFDEEGTAREHISTWKSPHNDPDEYGYVEIEVADSEHYATMPECMDVFQEPWPVNKPCDQKGCTEPSDTVQWRRLPTQYHKENLNWRWSCEVCFEEASDYYLDLWNEIR
jgi:hypothetical protein